MNKAFIRKKTDDLLLAFLLPAAVFLLILICYRIVPFGGTTLLFCDLDTQYVEFMAEYRRVLLGEGSFSWSWHAGLGMNFVALIAYYLASPFNFLLVLFPENQLSSAVSVLTGLKLGCAGAAFAYYLKCHSPVRIQIFPVFPLCYALSAYALGYSFNIMWLDALIWLPLLCAGIDRLLEDSKRGICGLTLLLALSFISQFYISWMTGAFCFLYFLAQILIRKKTFGLFARDLIRFGICVGLAGGLSAFLLLPTFFVLKNNMGLMGQEFPAFSGQFPFTQIFPKFFAGSFDGYKGCLPHVYCGLPAVIGSILFFLSKKVSVREKIVSGSLLCILLFSFWFAPLDFLWHAMDHPSWFPYRYAFVFCFWILSMAYKGISEFEKGSLAKKENLCAIVITCILLGISFVALEESRSCFLLLNGGLAAAYLTAILIKGQKIRQTALFLLASAEIFVNGYMIFSVYSDGYTKETDFRNFHEYYGSLTEAVMAADSDFYRMEKNVYRNYNDALGIGYPGISHFSSTASTRQTEFLKRLGFNCYATWCTYEGATGAADALLGIRYEFGNTGKQDSIFISADTWEHPARFPLFFFADEVFARYDFMAETDSITRQNDLLRLLEGENAEDYYDPVPAAILETENLVSNGGEDFLKVDPSQPAYFTASVEPVPGKSLYLFLPGASLSHTVTVNGRDELMNGSRDYAPFPICLDAYNSDEEIMIRIDAAKDELPGGIKAFALDTERLAALSRSISSSAPRLERTGNTSFRLFTDPAAEDRLIVSSIPFDAGWRITVNGEKLPLKMIHEGVLGFVLPAGCDEAAVTYQAYGMREGMILSGCSLLLCCALFWLEKRGMTC